MSQESDFNFVEKPRRIFTNVFLGIALTAVLIAASVAYSGIVDPETAMTAGAIVGFSLIPAALWCLRHER